MPDFGSHGRWLCPAHRCLSALLVAVLASAAGAQFAQGDPEDSIETPPKPIAVDEVRNPAQAHKLYWLGFYDEARRAYENLAKADKLEQPITSAALAALDGEARVRAVAMAIGLAEVDAMRGAYEAALRATAAVDPSWLSDESALHRRLVIVRLDVLHALGQYDEALAWTKAALDRQPKDVTYAYLHAKSLAELNRRAEAKDLLKPWWDTFVRRTPEGLYERLYGGQAMYLYSQLRGKIRSGFIGPILQDYFQRAYMDEDPESWPAYMASARMLANHYVVDQATEEAVAALRINPNLPQAYALLAEMDLENWRFERIEKRTERALAVNPRNAHALYVAAQGKMIERRFAEVIELCDDILRTNPRDPKAMALRAGAMFRQYRDEAANEYLAEIESQWPSDARVYLVIADALAAGRQYPAAEAFYEKAMEHNPLDANIKTAFGLMCMQTGEDQRARELLEASWQIDRYNVTTFNYLDLLDYLQGRKKGASFTTVESENFILRFDAAEDAVVGEYFLPALEDMHAMLAGDYDIELSDKTIVEIYPTQAKFAVRISGQPWIPTVGACTGRVIAMSAPRQDVGAGGGVYNWEQVLRHEYVHTLSLAATRNRIPHWFTEALAVAGEQTKRPWDWRVLLATAARSGELFPIDEIDWGFQRPRRPNARTQAYAQSEWMYEFIIQTWGFDAINGMLLGFREGLTQEAVLKRTLGVDQASFDRQFEQWALEDVARWNMRTDPIDTTLAMADVPDADSVDADDAARLLSIARAKQHAGALPEALTAAELALSVVAKDEDNPSKRWTDALAMVAHLSLIKSQVADLSELERTTTVLAARTSASRLAKLDDTDPTAPKVLAELAMAKRDFGAAIPHLKAYQQLQPLDPFSFSKLAGIHLIAGDNEAALPQLVQLAELDTHDPRLPRQVAAIHAENRNWHAAADWQWRSLMIDPYEPESHYEMGQYAEKIDDLSRAATEYAVAARLAPSNTRYREAARRLAKHRAAASEPQ